MEVHYRLQQCQHPEHWRAKGQITFKSKLSHSSKQALVSNWRQNGVSKITSPSHANFCSFLLISLFLFAWFNSISLTKPVCRCLLLLWIPYQSLSNYAAKAIKVELLLFTVEPTVIKSGVNSANKYHFPLWLKVNHSTMRWSGNSLMEASGCDSCRLQSLPKTFSLDATFTVPFCSVESWLDKYRWQNFVFQNGK